MFKHVRGQLTESERMRAGMRHTKATRFPVQKHTTIRHRTQMRLSLGLTRSTITVLGCAADGWSTTTTLLELCVAINTS